MRKEYEMAIGLEVHVELSTNTKIFCGCSTKFGKQPNTQTCPVCTGMPGALPVLNKKVVEYALKAGIALDCEINQYSMFDRKNYFYPDKPQGYQISQLYFPICYDGQLEINTDIGKKQVRIHEIHMEEDAGKLMHDEEEKTSLVDFNRSGVPLIEIVTEPDMKNAEEVIAFLEKLRCIMQYLEISDCKLQEGSMRVDVNLSVHPMVEKKLGTRTEMKNLNSFKAVERAIDAERKRQIDILQNGGVVTQETRRWDDNSGNSFAMRTKEDAKDYRYFPDPDLMPLQIDDVWIEQIKKEQPELREEKQNRYQIEYQLSKYDAAIITESKELSVFFEKVVERYNKPKKVVNWISGEVLRCLKEGHMTINEMRLSPENFALLVELVEDNVVNKNIAKEVFTEIFYSNENPKEFIEKNRLGMVSDMVFLEKIVDEVMREYDGAVSEYREGKVKVLGFLIGQVMKRSQGKANPIHIEDIFKQKM
ncbi:Asp-tRNA(Asn)/Glu-tRNA(Gln) amidotransferase subunit GatB [Lachnospiraceae bacterium OttesenSCG-928-E19]|nr:Asp-tRNA(Asn)/Glu-tRNA(Gln) amidotransferase subunit GatB [Lachnospiraceae bacterium OttesenSCG-928-E19]